MITAGSGLRTRHNNEIFDSAIIFGGAGEHCINSVVSVNTVTCCSACERAIFPFEILVN